MIYALNEMGKIIEAKEALPPSFVNAKDEIKNTFRKEQVNKKNIKGEES